MKKKSWLDKIAFSKLGVHYTWGYVVFLLIPALVIILITAIVIFSRH